MLLMCVVVDLNFDEPHLTDTTIARVEGAQAHRRETTYRQHQC